MKSIIPTKAQLQKINSATLKMLKQYLPLI